MEIWTYGDMEVWRFGDKGYEIVRAANTDFGMGGGTVPPHRGGT